jgi:hypothetical protein
MAERFISQAEKVLFETEEWRKTWKHRKPCRDWIQHEQAFGYGFCKHYAQARYRKYKQMIDSIFNLL